MCSGPGSITFSTCARVKAAGGRCERSVQPASAWASCQSSGSPSGNAKSWPITSRGGGGGALVRRMAYGGLPGFCCLGAAPKRGRADRVVLHAGRVDHIVLGGVPHVHGHLRLRHRLTDPDSALAAVELAGTDHGPPVVGHVVVPADPHRRRRAANPVRAGALRDVPPPGGALGTPAKPRPGALPLRPGQPVRHHAKLLGGAGRPRHCQKPAILAAPHRNHHLAATVPCLLDHQSSSSWPFHQRPNRPTKDTSAAAWSCSSTASRRTNAAPA